MTLLPQCRGYNKKGGEGGDSLPPQLHMYSSSRSIHSNSRKAVVAELTALSGTPTTATQKWNSWRTTIWYCMPVHGRIFPTECPSVNNLTCKNVGLSIRNQTTNNSRIVCDYWNPHTGESIITSDPVIVKFVPVHIPPPTTTGQPTTEQPNCIHSLTAQNQQQSLFPPSSLVRAAAVEREARKGVLTMHLWWCWSLYQLLQQWKQCFCSSAQWCVPRGTARYIGENLGYPTPWPGQVVSSAP